MNTSTKLVIVFLSLLLSCFFVFKATTYFFVDAAYNGMVADQYNYKIVLKAINEKNITEAQNYLLQLIEVNESLLEAAVNENNVSPETLDKMINVLNQDRVER